jgi:hypothetical protein
MALVVLVAMRQPWPVLNFGPCVYKPLGLYREEGSRNMSKEKN